MRRLFLSMQGMWKQKQWFGSKGVTTGIFATSICLGFSQYSNRARADQIVQQNQQQIIEESDNNKDEDKSGNQQFSENDLITPTSQLFISQESSRQTKLFVFSGSGNRELAKEVVAHLDVPLNRVSIHKNTETETEVQILDTVRGQHVFVIQSMSIPHVNDNIMELYLMCSALKRAGAAKVICIIPYFAYSRQTSQDKEKARRSLAGSDVCLMLQSMGCDEVVTINYGQQEVKGFFSPRVPLINIDVGEMVVPYLLSKQVENPVLISAHLRARNVKRLVGLQKLFGFFDQVPSLGFMIKGQDSTFEFIGESVKDRDCVLFENMIDSGKSLSEMALKLHQDGARRIFWFSPHGLFTDHSQKLIKNSYIDECIVTNTVEEVKPQNPKIRYLSIAKLLAEVISVMHSDCSLDQFRRSRSLLKYYSAPASADQTISLHDQPHNYQRTSFTFNL